MFAERLAYAWERCVIYLRPRELRSDPWGRVSWRYFPLARSGKHARSGTRALRVSFSGDYGVGSDGNRDMRTMLRALNIGVQTWKPDALIVDMRKLSYVWGDGMIAIVEFRNKTGSSQASLKTIIVTSPLNEAALGSLVGGLGSDTDKFFVRSLEEAHSLIEES